jgi:hypothetical protein
MRAVLDELEEKPPGADAPNSRTFTLSQSPVVEDGMSAPPAIRDAQPPSTRPRREIGPVLILLPRNSKQLFAFWDVDWTAAIDGSDGGERTIEVRVFHRDATEAGRSAVEATRGSCAIDVPVPGAQYYGAIGYLDSTGRWREVARSIPVATPADFVSPQDDAQFATIPFHLSFQRLSKLFRKVATEGEPLVGTVARLQREQANEDPSTSSEAPTVMSEAGIDSSQTAAAIRANEMPRPETGASSRSVYESELAKIISCRNSATSPSDGSHFASQAPPR